MSWVMTGAAAISAVSGLMAGNSAKKAAKKQADAAAKVEAMYGKINAPTVEEQKLMLDQFGYQGDFSPEAMEALGLGPSSMEGVSANQQAVDAQANALAGMQEIAEGGLSESDMAAAREIQRQTSNSDMARRKSILNEMAQRGTLDSGMELAAKLQGAQDTTETQASANDKLIQAAQARALQALSQTGDMSQQMRYQDFSEKSNIAKAKDAINEFNTRNRQSVNNENVDNRNQAQGRNLDARQQLNNQNVNLRNQEQINNKGLIQQGFQNQMQLTGAKAGAAQNTGAAQAGVDAARAATIGAIGQGLSSGLAAYGNYASNKKTPASNSSVDAAVDDMMNKNRGIF
jgi:hypothetical protein